MLTYAEIERVLAAAVGDPESGAVRDVLPLMAAAMSEALKPAGVALESRVIVPAETR
jgi:hypothetical protein